MAQDHEFSQEPSAANIPLDRSWPIHTKQHIPNTLSDEGMTGSHRADRVTLRNAHPHQSHSVGYHDSPMGQEHTNHGIEAVHIMHGKRDKGAEHHPPKGLYDPDAVNSY